MRTQAEILANQLAMSDGWSDPELLEAILEQGTAAIEPLLNIVRRDVYDEAGAEALGKACLLLGSLGTKSAIPEMVELFRRYDHDVLEDVYRALAILGPETVDPLLQIVRDESLRWYPRSLAAQSAIEAATQDTSLQATVAETLRGLLANYVARAETLDKENIEMVTSLVMHMSNLADPQDRELIQAAFEADIVDGSVIDPAQVAAAYKAGGPKMGQHRNWLARYRRDYQEHEAFLRQQEREASKPRPRPAPTKSAKPGRNDPCWCGSGLKYKRCHMRQDQGR